MHEKIQVILEVSKLQSFSWLVNGRKKTHDFSVGWLKSQKIISRIMSEEIEIVRCFYFQNHALP